MKFSELKGKKNLLLVIDAQIDFVDISGKLYVMGAMDAMKRLCSFIDVYRNIGVISDITLTRDNHYITHIGTPFAWLEGNPRHIIDNYPITISAAQVEAGVYEPAYITKEEAIHYLKAIEARGEMHHIWPEHCLHGSTGQQFPENLMSSLNLWARDMKKHYRIIDKGEYDGAEMYSAFSYADGTSPSWATEVLNDMAEYDNIFVAGFAKDYCVRYTLIDLMNDPRFQGKLIILDNCMAAINTKCEATARLWDEIAKSFGARIEDYPG